MATSTMDQPTRHGSVLSAIGWMFLLEILLFWIPFFGSLIAGFVGGKKAGTITATAFLKEFADGVSWAHLDIAGTAWGDPATPYRSKGPTGVAVRTLVEFIERSAH